MPIDPNARPPHPASPRPWWRRPTVVVLGSALALLLLAVGGTEVVLRLAGFGHPAAFFVPDEEPGAWRTNPNFVSTFRPASFGLEPEVWRISREKPADELRVFVLGDAAARGDPQPQFGLPRQLEVQLQAALPERRVRVYNLAVTGLNSHALVGIAREAMGFAPDLLVVYTGHDEVIGPFGPGADGAPAPARWRIRADLALQRLRLGQALARSGILRSDAMDTVQDWQGLEHVADQTVPADDPRLDRVYAHFAANLADVLAAAADAGVPVLVSTVAANLRDCAPFRSVPAAGLDETAVAAWREAFAAAQRAAAREDRAEAARWLRQALEHDPGHAETHYLLARALEQDGEADAARRHYEQALERDALRARADSAINRIVREQAAAAPGAVRLVDAAAALRDGGDPGGGRYFLDHVLLTWEGNVRLGAAVARDALALLGRAAPERRLGAAECAAALGFTDFGRHLMLTATEAARSRPPFTRQVTYPEDRTRLLQELALTEAVLAGPGGLTAVVAAIEAARERAPEVAKLWMHEAGARTRAGDPARALARLEEAAARLPWSLEVAAQRAYVLHQLGRAAEAEALLVEADRRRPDQPQVLVLLAAVWRDLRRNDEARGFLSSRLERLPRSLLVRQLLAGWLAADHEWAAAEAHWRIMLQLQPDHPVALDGLLRRLFSRDRADEAIAVLEAAFAYNPRNADVNSRLVQYYQAHRDAEKQVKYLGALAASGPVPAELLVERAAVLLRLGRREEMLADLRRARHLARQQGDDALRAEIERRLQEEDPGGGR